MAAIFISTVGTTGEVEPYLALARGLIARGHRVRVASHQMHAPRFDGIEFIPAAADVDVAEYNRVLDEVAARTEPLDQFLVLVERIFLRDASAQLARYLDAAKGADLAICNRYDYLGQEAALAQGVRWIGMALTPEFFRTDEAPPFPFPRLGRWFARSAWDAVEKHSARTNEAIARMLIAAGGKPRPLGVAGADSPLLNVITASPLLIPVRKDWPSSVIATGPWISPPDPYQPEPALAAFLEENPRPVVVTFGSMGGSNKAETNQIISDALVRVRRPTIVQAGYQGLGGNRTEKLFSAGFVPHDFLFRKAGCIVHHAGAGTAHAVLRAGVPSVPVPHLFDQYYFAGMLHRRNVAPKPIFRRGLDAKTLAARIDEAIGSTRMRENAERLGERMRGEDGVAATMAAIDRLL